jgi:hypothetical protein
VFYGYEEKEERRRVAMGLLMKLFGTRYRVRFEGVFEDGGEFTGKTVVEVLDAQPVQIIEHLKEDMFVESGRRVKSLIIVAAVRE